MYGVDDRKFQRQYKQSISNFKNWKQKSHAEDWILYPENLSYHLSLDEVALSDGELYTVLTSKKAMGRKGSIVAIIKGTKSDRNRISLKNQQKIKVKCKRNYFGYGRFYEAHRQKMFSQCHTNYRPIPCPEISHRSVAGIKDKPPLGNYRLA